MSQIQPLGEQNGTLDIVSEHLGGYATGRRLSSAHIRVDFIGCIKSEIVKLVSLVSTRWLIGLTVLLFPLISVISVVSLKEKASTDLQIGSRLAVPKPLGWSDIWYQIGSSTATLAIVIGIFGVMSIASEFTTGSIQSSLIVNPRRTTFLNAKAVAVALFSFFASLLGIFLACLIVVLMTTGLSTSPLPRFQDKAPLIIIFGGALIMSLTSILSLGLGTICRSTAGGICTMLGIFFLLPLIANIFSAFARNRGWLSTIVTCLPNESILIFSAGGLTASDQSAQVISGFHPIWWQSGLIFVAWTAAFYIVGVAMFNHRDIS